MKKTLILIVLIVLIQNVGAIGVGISPSNIKIDNALKGNVYERALTIVNPSPDTNGFSFSVNGDISEWVDFYDLENQDVKITSIEVPGKSTAHALIKFHIPEDVANGNYTGNILVKSIPADDNTGSSESKMVVGVPLSVNIVVTGNQIVDGFVKGILIDDKTELGFPLNVQILFQNIGNVIANPKIDVVILQDGNSIDSFSHAGAKVKPGNSETIQTQWNTTASNIPGEYIANVSVSLEGRTIKSKTVPFEILPVGTLTRSGNLTDILIEGEPAADTLVKVKAHFKNSGMIVTPAKFSGEVYKDGNLIDTLTSDELTVEKNKEAVLISYLKLESPGDYLIKGKVVYSGKETPVKEVTLKVPNEKSIPGFEGIYLTISILVLFILNRKRNTI